MSYSDHNLRDVLKRSLGKRVREISPGDLWRMALHGAIVAGCFVALCGLPSYLSLTAVLLSILIGHSYACLAFLAHSVSHGSVVRGKHLRYALEFLLWTPLIVPPTVWRILHNRTHHHHANTPADCDRAYIVSDQHLGAKAWYMRLFSPLKGSLGRWNPLSLVHFPTYMIRNILLLGADIRLPFVAAVPRVTTQERVTILFEIVLLIGLHAWFVAFMWRDAGTLLVVEIIPITVASSVLMAFIFTNHLSKPVLHEGDILQTTVSLRIPRFLSWLYSDFNYHVEHHLFPSTPSKHYAIVSRELQKLTGGQYSYPTFVEAWKEVLASPFLRPEVEPIDKSTTNFCAANKDQKNHTSTDH